MITKYNARDVVFQIEDPDNTDVWVEISRQAVSTFTKGTTEETTDTTVFGSEGDSESQKMQLGKTLSLQGFRLMDPATGALDPGQALVETLADRKGEDSLGRMRFAHKDEPTWRVWTAHVTLGDEGGGNNAKTSWSATFTRSGADSTVAKS